MTDNRFRELRQKAPNDLRTELEAIVSAPSKRQLHISVSLGSWLGAALSVAAVACLLLWSTFGVRRSSDDLVMSEVAHSHIRSMMGDHLLDVASTDQHTVKPWFGGKLDFSPIVVDLTDIGFPLVGGRLDYIAARPVAALVYKYDQHVINLFTWPDSGDSSKTLKFASSQGFSVWHWSVDGMNFFAVSDLNANSLKLFAEKLRNL